MRRIVFIVLIACFVLLGTGTLRFIHDLEQRSQSAFFGDHGTTPHLMIHPITATRRAKCVSSCMRR